jgi:hypothetical protein
VPPDAASRKLSQVDAFFVAYQERAGILMQLGVELELQGTVTRGDLERMVECMVQWWPPLGQRLQRRALGLVWHGAPQVHRMLVEGRDRRDIAAWRNRPIDPFVEPTFQVLWIPHNSRPILALRAHHAVADGESSFLAFTEALLALATIRGGTLRLLETPVPPTAGRPSLGKLWRVRNLPAMVRYIRRLRHEALGGRSARLAVRSVSPGPIGIVERALSCDDLRAIRERAAGARTSAPWLCAAAWVRAIHRWNSTHSDTASQYISLEVPVSLRRSRDRGLPVGNLISPLVLSGDARKPLEFVARSLRRQFITAVNDGCHLIVPLLTTPARYLPWALFRRAAVNTSTTGSATSHFTWLSQSRDPFSQITARSQGSLEVSHLRIYTPVCLHMGAALAALAWPDRLQLFISYRATALTRDDAETLGDLVVGELARSTANGAARIAGADR